MTSSERWRRLEEVYQAALDLRREQRDTYLRKACGDDIEMRDEARQLLAFDDTESSRIASIIEGTAAALFDGEPELDRMTGLELGAYRILREIGRGGMGAVYLAIRSDRAFDKQVAIKLVKRGIDTDAVLERFWHERRILAALDHPFIAHLIDGGTSPDGRPYFVMEYVDGQPLDNYAAAHNLSIAQRCELFRKICEAVSYAHRNLVIHRDIKPANIVVTPDGTPKLLDFGIARLLSADPGDRTIGNGILTGHHLTPEFASPEQIHGQAVTTATDVYSLGATLRALLAGFKLPHDLTTIINKATRQESDQRFASVADLSEDVRRYLAGLPIQARDQTLLYRSGKFVRRHRAGVAFVVLLALLLFAGIGAVIWEAREAEREKESAEQRLIQAVEIADRTLADVNNSMADLPGSTEARRQILRHTLEYLDRLDRDSGGDPRVLGALASAYAQAGKVLGNSSTANLGDLPGALATYRKAFEIVDRLNKTGSPNPKRQALEETVLQGTGNILESMGKDADAEKQYRQAVQIADELLAREPGAADSQLESIHAHFALDWLLYTSRPNDAEVDARRQLPLAIALAGRMPHSLEALSTLSDIHSLLGTSLNRNNRMEESLAAYRKAVEIRENEIRLNPRNNRIQRDLMIGYGHIADMLGSPLMANMADYLGAVEYYAKAERIAERMSAADPSDVRARYDVGMVWTRIGASAWAARDVRAASEALDKAVSAFDPLVKSSPGSATYARGLALACEFRGRTFWLAGDREHALSSFRRSVAAVEKFAGPGPLDRSVRGQLAAAKGTMAILLALDSDRDSALETAKDAIQLSSDLAPHNPARAWDCYGQTCEALKDYAAALAAYGQSLRLWKTVPRLAVSPALQAELRATQQRAQLCRRRVATW